MRWQSAHWECAGICRQQHPQVKEKYKNQTEKWYAWLSIGFVNSPRFWKIGRNFLIMDGMKMRWYQCLGVSPPKNSCSGKWVLFKGLVTCTQYCSITEESILSLNAMHNIANPRFYLLSLDCVSPALTARCRKTKFCPLLAASFSWLWGLRTSWEGLRTSREGLRTSGE